MATRAAMDRASDFLLSGDTHRASDAAWEAFRLARDQRSHPLVSDTWVFLPDTLASDPDAALSIERKRGGHRQVHRRPDG